ncbi:MAG: monovalent cation/H(+) antiporter subunit G [Vicinamibacterales bacterium]|nr:monovalent cation/H(+) antiporter subunit G [Vicinamibacterales bacterium]
MNVESVTAGIALALMFTGVVFLAVAAIGFVRFPDVFSRLHVTGVIDTLGVPLILLGAAVYAGLTLTSAKLLLGIVFLFGTSPLVGHLLGQSAARTRTRPDPDAAGENGT